MKRYVAMTPEKITLAKKLIAQGQRWSHIEHVVGHCEQTIREAIDPEARLQRRAKQYKRREDEGYKSERLPDRVDDRPISRNPKYDPNRDGPRQYTSPFAQLLGEPPIGQRAIDKQGPRA